MDFGPIEWRPKFATKQGENALCAPTPFLAIKEEEMMKNMNKMMELMKQWPNVDLRPHFKAHKSVDIAKQQIKLGAVGICCQTLTEAESAVYGGSIEDVFISNEVIGVGKVKRVVQLALKSKISICVDNEENIKDLSQLAKESNANLDLVIEVNVGQDRCGIKPGADVVPLAKLVESLPNVHFKGIQAYHGWNQHVRSAAERKERTNTVAGLAQKTVECLQSANIKCPYITGGGTGTFPYEAGTGLFTEIQPGSYVFMDADYNRNLNEKETFYSGFVQSLFIYTTVQSITGDERAVVDSGMKAASLDSGPPLVAGKEDSVIYHSGGDEHGILRPNDGFKVGQVIQLIPGHCDPTVNLHDVYYLIDGNEKVKAILPVNARDAGV
ncbi:DgyrCDS9352 [Dimorphilus gyrociliatus]|nr:DgyrCDS9352 [Dimorphilus gyrociliatus]